MTALPYFVALHGNTLVDIPVKKSYRLTPCAAIPFGKRPENQLRGPKELNSRNKAINPWSIDTVDGRKAADV